MHDFMLQNNHAIPNNSQVVDETPRHEGGKYRRYSDLLDIAGWKLSLPNGYWFFSSSACSNACSRSTIASPGLSAASYCSFSASSCSLL